MHHTWSHIVSYCTAQAVLSPGVGNWEDDQEGLNTQLERITQVRERMHDRGVGCGVVQCVAGGARLAHV